MEFNNFRFGGTEKLRSLKEFIDIEKSRAALNRDVYQPLNDFKFQAYIQNKRVLVRAINKDKKEFELTDGARNQLADKLGFPVKMIDKLQDPELSATIFDKLLTRMPNKNDCLIRYSGNDTIRAVLSSDYKVFDMPNILDSVHNSSYLNDWKVASAYSDGQISRYQLVDETVTDLVKGEEARRMVYINNSEVGSHSLEVRLAIFVCTCLNRNLAIRKQGVLKIYHTLNAFRQMREPLDMLMNGSADIYHEMGHKYKTAEEINIPQPELFLKGILAHRSVNFSSLGRDKVWSEYEGPIENGSLRDVVDTYTQAAHKHYEPIDDDYNKLEYLGADVLENYQEWANRLSRLNTIVDSEAMFEFDVASLRQR